MLPDHAHGWLKTLLPLAQQGGPIVSLLLAVVMCISLWWMSGWLSECIDRNRVMASQLVSQQKEFHNEILMRLANCPPRP